jgi:hypothetical protein
VVVYNVLAFAPPTGRRTDIQAARLASGQPRLSVWRAAWV